MCKPRILIENKIPFIKGRLEPVAEVRYFDGPELCPELVRDADALLVRTRDICNEALLGKSSVRLVATGTIGTDHIDTEWCRSAGITVRNSAGCNAPGVAQYVLASLLHLYGRIDGLTLGVVGVGNVGSVTAEWAGAAGMNVLCCDPPRERSGSQLGYNPDRWYTLDHVLTHSDIVTLHVPLTRRGDDATFHLIGERECRLMADAGVRAFINAARGAVADTDALAACAEAGGPLMLIDTWEHEPDPDRRMLRLAATATPHIAGYSAEGKRRATRMLLEAVTDFFGIHPDMSGLTPAYTPLADRGAVFSADVLADSYSPAEGTLRLKAEPGSFEHFRESWTLRPEPEFSTSTQQ